MRKVGIGRKSLINIARRVGIPMEVYVSMSGHEDYKTVKKHYESID